MSVQFVRFKSWISPVMIYLAPETKAQESTLLSSGSFSTTLSILLSGYSSVISNIAEINSSPYVLCLVMKGEKKGRFKTSKSSSSKRGVIHRVKSPFSTNLIRLCGGPCQKVLI